jgi:translation initiation factor IF-3
MDYGNYLYKQKRAERKQKRSQKQTEVKGIRLSIRTGQHDLEVKAKQAIKFLEKRNIVKVNLILKGREMSHLSLAQKKIHEFSSLLDEHATIEQEPKLQGSQLTMILNPAIKK